MLRTSLALLAWLPFVSAAQWSTLGLPGDQGRYDDIFFLDADEGWACNGDGFIYHTTNGGDTWELQYNSPTDDYLRCIEFATPQHGFCGTLDDRLLETTDGGATWHDIMDRVPADIPGICGLSAPTPDVIYGVGIWSVPGYVIRSTDAGLTWTHIDMSAHARALVDVHFISPLEGFVSGMAEVASGGGVLLHTTDGGATWTELHRTNMTGEYIWKIQSPDGQHFFASIDGNPAAGNTRFLSSDDAGQSWTSRVATNSYNYIQAIGFITPHHGWMGGNNTLLETNDGGDTWTPAFLWNGYNRFFKVNDSTAYLTSFRVHRWNGPWTTRVEQPVPNMQEDHLLEVSPNPSTGLLTIAVDLKRAGYTKVHVHGADGRLVTTVADGRMPAGRAQWAVDLSGLPAQQLVVVLHTNDGQLHRRVVLSP